MPLNPGRDVVTFIYPGITNDRLHKFATTAASTQFNQTGCNVQPISVDDKVTDTAYSEATDRCLTPFVDAMAAVKAEWKASWGGKTYRVLGVKPHRDNFGRGLHYTVIVKYENG